MAPVIKSFPPVCKPGARILILGSMPGEASLQANEYYAFKHNQFWRIMGELTGAAPDLPYKDRLNYLINAGFSMWDVLQSCMRHGSLDKSISEETPNDLPDLLAKHSSIKTIGFNGRKAEEAYFKHFPELKAANYNFKSLPSTSPAHATLTYEQKLESWKTLLHET